jgi:siroheme decarboxylase
MIHARDEASCIKTVERISRDTGIARYTVLFSRKELKKTSMKYFSTDEES